MECQILIKGSLSEIQQVLRVLTTGTHVLATIEETVGSIENKYEHPKPEKTPDPVVMLTPMGPLPVVPAPHPIVKPVEQKRPEITTTKPVNSDHIPEVRKMVLFCKI